MILAAITQLIISFLALSWWFWAFLIFLPVAASLWLFWRQEIFKEDLQQTMILLELRIPREIRKNPRAMEQVLTSLYSFRNSAANVAEEWWEGEITRWYALEMVGFGGEVHFYIRLYKKQKGLMQAAFLSYYPDIEIEEVEDYIGKFPASVKEMYAQGYDLWGSEIELKRPDAYPIKTYSEFEAVDEDKQYDPISAFLELFSKLQKEEILAIQILLAPASSSWYQAWSSLVEELRSKKDKPGKPKTATEFPSELVVPGPLPKFEVVPPGQSGDGTAQIFRSFIRTPGETDVLKAVERNLSKPAFDTLIRFVYLSPQTLFYDTFPRRGVNSVFNQFTALDLNSFQRNETTGTRVTFWTYGVPNFFHKRRNEYRKMRILYNYRRREIPPETVMGRVLTSRLFNWNFVSHRFILNTESVATIFHPPTFLVLTAPHIRRVESRKTGPPAGVPIFGGEEEIEKFQNEPLRSKAGWYEDDSVSSLTEGGANEAVPSGSSSASTPPKSSLAGPGSGATASEDSSQLRV